MCIYEKNIETIYKAMGSDYYNAHCFLVTILYYLTYVIELEGFIYVGCHCRKLKCIPSKFLIPIVTTYCFNDNNEFSSVIFNDEQGVYDFANNIELKIGKDVAIIGFDNREASQAYNPPLSTMELPLFEIVRHSAKVLINILNEPNKEVEHDNYKIDCNFVERKSIYIK
jgi:DNA-binding LacI/PurR family transcriptional regulator